MSRLQKYPFHPLFLAIYPVLALLAVNIHEVSSSVIWRPLAVVLVATIILFVVIRLLLHEWHKAALVTSFGLVLFFTYGRLYDLLKTTSLVETGIIRHRYLIVLFLALWIAAIWIILKHIRNVRSVTGILNLVSLILVLLPLVQIGSYLFKTASDARAIKESAAADNLPDLRATGVKPDVYYIILDTYTRSDILASDLGFDNSDFIQKLEDLGFYVASCSRSNYNNTVKSLVSAMNMSYLPELYAQAAKEGLSEEDTWVLLKPSSVRRNFKDLGYEIVAFDTGYAWNSLEDADLYLARDRYASSTQFINPFEQMLLDTSVLSIYSDFNQKANWDKYSSSSHPLANYIGQQEFILDQLPMIATLSASTFTYAHINIPHAPLVFSPDGYLTDPDYWSGPYMKAADDAHFRSGYIQSIEFINNRMLAIIQEILQKSDTPPIIILQGDHGYWKDSGGLPPILNAYYLPGLDQGMLYPSISPVNTFRLVFNTYFGGQYDLFADESFDIYDISTPLIETSPDCQR
jgi:uncharacterized membrane protein YozB (DUF420 family)